MVPIKVEPSPSFDREETTYSADCDISKLSSDFSNCLLSEKSGFTTPDLDRLREYYLKHHLENEYIYHIFASCYMDRKLWSKARSDLYCRLYFIDHNSDAYTQTMDMIKLVEEKLLEDVISLPLVYKESMFARYLGDYQGAWTSRMGYTDHMKTQTYQVVDCKDEPIAVSKIGLRPGDLLLRTTPLSVAPWNFDSHYYLDSKANNVSNNYCCFHCLRIREKFIGSPNITNTHISCPVNPYECKYSFCSEECFLNNAAIHSEECKHLDNLRVFSEKTLNDAIVLLVVRTLIRFKLCQRSESKTIELSGNVADQCKDELLNRILNIKINYSVLKSKYGRMLDDINKLAYFLLDSFGVEFCLYLTFRELSHFIVVLWVKSIPIITETNYQVGCFDNILGGVFFTFKTLEFQESPTPNCVLHFDNHGKITIRSIYEMESGTKLSINTSMDKYMPHFLHHNYFWSISSSLLYSNGTQVPKYYNDIFSIRCKKCINAFCYSTECVYPQNSHDSSTSNLDTTQSIKCPEPIWVCDNCSDLHIANLNLLNNRGHQILYKAQCLFNEGQYLLSKRLLENFISRWSGVLHPNHYLMYNANILLAGFLMNGAGGSLVNALYHLRRAAIMANDILPMVCHERAHLYSKLSDLMFQVYFLVNVKRSASTRTKKSILEVAYNALWNWIIISGYNSNEALLAMRRCRRLAFELNIHVPPISQKLVINLPSRYMDIFKVATGNRLVTESLMNKFDNDFNSQDVERAGDDENDYTCISSVAENAFIAAQNGESSDSILNVLTSIESYGILHHGTGLNILAIAASNHNVGLIKNLLPYVRRRIVEYLEIIRNSSEETDMIAHYEHSVMNLVLCISCGNELGITPLIAMASTLKLVPHFCSDNENGNTSSFVKYSDVTIVRVMIDHGEKCNEILRSYRGKLNSNTCSNTFIKFIDGDIDLISLMLNTRTHVLLNGQSALHYAAVRGKGDLVQYLARSGCDINKMNLEGATPLHLAALNGHHEVVRILLSFGAKNIPLITGETPFHLAIYSLDEETIKLFIESYAKDKKCVTNKEKVCSLHYKKGPSIWHALVGGISQRSNELESSKNSQLCLEDLVNNLKKAIDVTHLIIKSMHLHEIFEIYTWANVLPSEMLWDYWIHLLEKYSFCNTSEDLNALHATVGGLTNNIKAATGVMKPTQHCSVTYPNRLSSNETNKDVDFINNQSETLFTSTRALQFLVQILKRIEGSENRKGVK